MEFIQFVEVAFYGIISGSVILAVRVLSGLTSSINDLNAKIGILIIQHENHDETIKGHSKRITRLENK